MLKMSYYIICFGDAAAYRVYAYMLYLLQGGRSTGYCTRWVVLVHKHYPTRTKASRLPPCKGYNIYAYTQYASASPKHII